MKLLHLLALASVTIALLAPAETEAQQDTPTLRVANIFSDNMVIQRDKPIRVWGWAKPRERITITLTENRDEVVAKVGKAGLLRPLDEKERQQQQRDWENAKGKPVVSLTYVQKNVPPAPTRELQVTADGDGYWLAELEGLDGSFTPKYLLVRDRATRLAFGNILIGEVWVTAGQSNMAWAGARENMWEKEGLIFNGLRYTTHSDSWYKPKADLNARANWLVCEDGKLSRLSAIPYMFGKFIHRKLKVPVGIINVATGGSYGNNWAARTELDKIDLDVIKRMLAVTDTRTTLWETAAARQKILDNAKAAFAPQLAEWDKLAAAAKAAGERAPRKPNFRAPGDPRAGGGPGYLFHGRVASVARLNVRGAMYLQGEQQSLGGAKWSQYEQVFPAVVRSFRAAFRQDDLPFGIITLQGMGQRRNQPERDANANGYVNVRDIHYRTHLTTPGTGFICAHDVGGGVHPDWKRPVAERAAYWALRDVYRAIRPPRTSVKEIKFDGGKVYVYFKRETWGQNREAKKMEWREDPRLAIPRTNDSAAMDGFAIAGKDRRWYPAKLSVDPNRRCLVVWSDLLIDPVALRYGWSGYPHANLGDWYDPIPPFRTDTWPVMTVGLGTKEENAKDRARLFGARNVARVQEMDREIRQSLSGLHLLELKLYGDPKRILTSKLNRITMILDELKPAAFGQQARRLSAEGLSSVTGQYFKPEGFWEKWQPGFDQAVRLDQLPDKMTDVLARKQLQTQLAAARAALEKVQAELAKLPDPEPVTYERAKYLLDRAKKALADKGIDWRRIVRSNTPVTVDDLKE